MAVRSVTQVERFGFLLAIVLGLWLLIPFNFFHVTQGASFVLAYSNGTIYDHIFIGCVLTFLGLSGLLIVSNSAKSNNITWAISMTLCLAYIIIGVDSLVSNPALPGGPTLLTLAVWKMVTLYRRRRFS